MATALVLGTGASTVAPIGDGLGGDGVDTPIPLPSGQEATLLDVVTAEEGFLGLTYRFRFVAPWVADTVDPDAIFGDMGYLCEAYALPRLSSIGPQPSQIIISMSAAPVEFGAISPDVVQFFEAYRREGDTCVWELF